MMCGAADEGSAALFVCGGEGRSQILGLEDGRSGLDLPGGQIGVKLLCVEGESVLEDGRIGWICPEGESA